MAIMPTRTQIVGLAVIVLFISVAFPTFISSSVENNITETTTLEGEGDSAVLDGSVRLTLDTKTNSDANITYVHLESGDAASIQLSETETGTVQVDGEQITTTALDIGTGTSGEVVIKSTFPKSLAWDSGSRTLSDNIPVILAGIAVMIVVGIAAGVVRE